MQLQGFLTGLESVTDLKYKSIFAVYNQKKRVKVCIGEKNTYPTVAALAVDFEIVEAGAVSCFCCTWKQL